ncbi:MAG TPA: glycosyltransferase family 4 protein [Chthoniobacterales bacterium]|nr:glycosyltransferase family 4 protein [Chthoniobacterales bacterium]
MKKVVLFHRDFQRFTGGHLKVWDYFNHVLASTDYEPRIAFSSESKWDDSNPWNNSKEYVTQWTPEIADVLFLAGKDWNALPDLTTTSSSKPIINLIQHPRHADPKDKLYRFLENRAIRICVSQQAADAINATGKVNGPVFVIPNGIDVRDMPAHSGGHARSIQVLNCGIKAPDLAREIDKRLERDENVAVTPLLEWLPRSQYLDRLVQASVVIALPRPREGFYLPAIEAMACGAIVVCPDCVGNRDFCKDGVNCFRPAYDADAILAAIYRALSLSPEEAEAMRENAYATVREHSLDRERGQFLEILRKMDQFWTS